MYKAILFTKQEDKKVQCFLCRHNCIISDGETGICNVRKNENGELFSIFYGKPIAMAVDPIEKKPLFHFHPNTKSFSIAAPGCNFKCPFCQNWQISQYDKTLSPKIERQVLPEKIVSLAKGHKCKSISYTYTEPTVFFEYALDTAKLAAKQNIANIFVTNGYISRQAIDEIKPYLQAANIDLKSFRKDKYRNIMRAQLDGVLDTIKYMKQAGIWVEVTTLIVPKVNDDISELKDIAKFLVEVGRDIPWHISRFYPNYQYADQKQTPMTILKAAYEIGKNEGLRYIYLGNVPNDKFENTYCYKCNTKLISRTGYKILENIITDKSKCPKCESEIDGVNMY